MGEVVAIERLLARCAARRFRGQRIVLTNGCFDLLHVGHVRSLAAARQVGDCLVVGVNDDESVRRLKGPTRPIVPATERAELIAALACVDEVVVFDGATAVGLVQAVRPEVYVKGDDYGSGGKPLPEADVVESYGGRVALLALVPGRSTSDLIATILGRGERREERGARSVPPFPSLLPPLSSTVSPRSTGLAAGTSAAVHRSRRTRAGGR